MTVTTRFAPSPTGWIHVGNLRTALILASCAAVFFAGFIAQFWLLR